MSIYDTYEVVKDKRLLNKMAKEGLIKLHEHTGKMVEWYYGNVKAWYVDDVYSPIFEFQGEKYGREYFIGCFFPYVVKYTRDK